MNSTASLMPAMAVLMAASACFTVPVGTPGNVALDSALVGQWQCRSVEAKSEDRALLNVMRFDAQQYYAEWSEGDKLERYRAYPVRLAGVTVLSVGDLAPSQWPWTAVRYSLPEVGTLILQLPAQRILDMSDDEAAIQELTAKADRTDTWQSFAWCERAKDGA